MTDKFNHVGRAAVCPCREIEGQRCPDCNHLLTGEIMYMLGSDEEQHICEICGRVYPGITRNSTTLDVQDANQENLNQF